MKEEEGEGLKLRQVAAMSEPLCCFTSGVGLCSATVKRSVTLAATDKNTDYGFHLELHKPNTWESAQENEVGPMDFVFGFVFSFLIHKKKLNMNFYFLFFALN